MRPTTLLLFTTLATSYPIYATLNIDKSTGALRPSSLITRQLDLLDLTASDNADSPTGSSTSVCGLLGCGSSSESASDVTSSSSSSACQALGGCTSSASAACQFEVDDAQATNSSTSSSLCGSGSSTDSSSFISLGGSKLKRWLGVGHVEYQR
ncbi:hypothetical protein PMZ80_010910 [Knufia obscura]|uniref:Uncharacterized protein n=1 Tax=Knufia obscura TaxID=1635080 RepID=A0ABR0R832_9EURO|nr:hypothetical protein PMZ80_010910 [Knufia obscura]